jgi:phage-related baseplate assembly protein
MAPPDIIETLDYETILTALKDDFQARLTALDLDWDVRELESDPAVKILEVAAAREIHLRARVNGAAKALLLSQAQKNDLAHLGAWFGVERLVVQEATEADPEILESDERLRYRIQLAPQAFSTAGAYGAYEFHALTAAPTVKSVGITNPLPGYVNVYPLEDDGGDGYPSDEVLTAIRKRFIDEDVVPLTDIVSVAAPVIKHTDIYATLLVREGPSIDLLVENARAAVQTYADSRHKVGRVLRLSGIFQAAQGSGPGIDGVLIHTPEADLDPGANGAVYVDNVKVDYQLIESLRIG